MNTDRNKIDPVEQFHLDLTALALEHPHTATISENRQFKTRFFNVYFKEVAEQYLASVDLHPDYAYLMVGRLVAQGYEVKFIPRNKHGYCQCTISRKSGETDGLTEVLTGEAGKMYKAVLSAVAKHILILRDAGEGETYWAGRKQNTIDGDGFR